MKNRARRQTIPPTNPITHKTPKNPYKHTQDPANFRVPPLTQNPSPQDSDFALSKTRILPPPGRDFCQPQVSNSDNHIRLDTIWNSKQHFTPIPKEEK